METELAGHLHLGPLSNCVRETALPQEWLLVQTECLDGAWMVIPHQSLCLRDFLIDSYKEWELVGPLPEPQVGNWSWIGMGGEGRSGYIGVTAGAAGTACLTQGWSNLSSPLFPLLPSCMIGFPWASFTIKWHCLTFSYPDVRAQMLAQRGFHHSSSLLHRRAMLLFCCLVAKLCLTHSKATIKP